MFTREIPREDWTEFFNTLSRQHEGWRVTIEVLDEDLGPEVEARKLPLKGITADVRDDGRDTISIIAGEALREHVVHLITEPIHVRLAETEEGAHQAIQIESASRTTTLVIFRSAMLPAMVDDVVMR